MGTFASSFGQRRSEAGNERLTRRQFFEDRVIRFLDGLVTFGLWIIVFAVPFMMAGIRELGAGVFVASTFLMAVAWAIRQLIRPEQASAFCVGTWIFGAATALVCFQLVPLPEWLLHRVSPFSAEYLTVWDGSQQLPRNIKWSTVSMRQR